METTVTQSNPDVHLVKFGLSDLTTVLILTTFGATFAFLSVMLPALAWWQRCGGLLIALLVGLGAMFAWELIPYRAERSANSAH